MKSASEITDRAKRYRANSETSDWPRVCMFCGSTDDLQVDHLDGFEENGEAENLMMLCRSCNQLKSAVYVEQGLGRRTVQYNPGAVSRLFSTKEKTFIRQVMDTQSKLRSMADIEPIEITRYKGFTIYQKGHRPNIVFYSTLDPDAWMGSQQQAEFLVDAYKNPAAGVAHWENAVKVLRGEKPGSAFSAARTIRSTPVSRRYQYLDRMMRANPSVPTFAQYAFAVSTHERGAHDEGGAIIHATPKKLRSEYAERIADVKRGRGTGRKSEVPF